MVQVTVGKPPKEYWLHRKLLMARSDYFKMAFAEDRFMEGRTGALVMEEDDPDAFDMFVNWLYTDRLPDPEMQAQMIDNSDTIRSLTVLKFFTLADKVLLGSQVKRDLMDCFLKHCHQGNIAVVGVGFLSTAFRNTAEDCPMRRVVIDLFCGVLLTNKLSDKIWPNLVTMYLQGCEQLEIAKVMQNLIVMERDKDIFRNLKVKYRSNESVASLSRYQTGFLRPKTPGSPNGKVSTDA